MKALWLLVINEMEKLFCRRAVKVLFVFTIALVFYMCSKATLFNTDDESNDIPNIPTFLTEGYSEEFDELEKSGIVGEEYKLKYRIYKCRTNEDFIPGTWEASALTEAESLVIDNPKHCSELVAFVENGNWKKYVQSCIDEIDIENNASCEKRALLYTYEVALKAEVPPVTEDFFIVCNKSANQIWRETNIFNVYKQELALLQLPSDEASVAFNHDERNKIEDSKIASEYRLMNQYAPSGKGIYSFYDVAMRYSSVLILIIIFIASELVSSEFTGKNIKTLLVSPNSRNKILTSKLITLSLFSLVIVLLYFICSIIAAKIYYGFTPSGVKYVFVIDSKACSISYTAYFALRLMLKYVEIMLYALLCFMISVLMKHNATAIICSLTLSAISIYSSYCANNDLDFFGEKIGGVDKYVLIYITDFSRYLPEGKRMFSNLSLAENIVLVLCYAAVFITVSYDSFRKA